MDGTGEHHLKWSYPGSERLSLHVFSHMWKTGPTTNTSIIIYALHIQNTFPKRKWQGLNNIEIHHICVGTGHNKCNENCWTIQGRGKGWGRVMEGLDNTFTSKIPRWNPTEQWTDP
jgi:hypothetical protein